MKMEDLKKLKLIVENHPEKRNNLLGDFETSDADILIFPRMPFKEKTYVYFKKVEVRNAVARPLGFNIKKSDSFNPNEPVNEFYGMSNQGVPATEALIKHFLETGKNDTIFVQVDCLFGYPISEESLISDDSLFIELNEKKGENK